MLRGFAEGFLQHQALTFAAFGMVAAACALLLLRRLGRLELFTDLTEGEAAGAGRPRRWLPWILFTIVVLSVGYVAGSWGRTDPIPGTALLGMPDLTCDRRGKELILFLHGWRGDPVETWRQFPQLVCGDNDFRDVDVLSIGYPMYLIGRNPSMDGFASWLGDKLLANGIQHYERIVVVAHSIGGLLARRIVLGTRPDLKNVVLLVEIATPHDGPRDYAQLANNLALTGGQIVAELKQGSAFLQRLKTDWKAALPPLPHTYCSASPDDWVVTTESAFDGCDETHILPALDHRELVKPTTRKEDRYTIPMYTAKKYLR